jgi:hypothetical protein
MKHPFIEIGRGAQASGGFIEVMCETAVALAVAAAICIGVISLSVHLNEASNARAPGNGATMAAVPSGSAGTAVGSVHVN